MSFPQQQWAHRIPNPLLQAEQYNVDEMATLVDKQRAVFNPDQAAAFDAVLESVTNNQGHLFFIHAAGGCGKTFLCNTIAVEVRRRGQVALCVASSRIAALLLDGGKTSHSYFKIPLSIHEDSVAGLKHNSYMFPVLQQTKIIIWDKVMKFILFSFVITPPPFLAFQMMFSEHPLHSCYLFFSCLIIFQDERHIQKYLKHVYS